jgi:DNA polymerase
MGKYSILRSYFIYLKNLEIEELPKTPRIEKFLSEIKKPKKFFVDEHTLKEEVLNCTACPLSQTRKAAIFGEGKLSAKIMVILDYPRRDEELQGLVITGGYRTMLQRLLQTLAINLEDVFLTHAVKCRPYNDRPLEDEEVLACKEHLLKQIQVIKPKVILCFGSTPIRSFLGTERKITLNEARKATFNFEGIPLFFTFHPEDMTKNSQVRRLIWEDLQRVKECLKKEFS